MRIIHVVPAIAQESSGPSYSVTKLCESLDSLGNDVTLATLDWAPLPIVPAFVELFPIGAGPRKLGRSPALKRWLRASVSQGGVSVVHSHGMWQMNSIYPSLATSDSCAKLVVSPRGAFSTWAMSYGSWTKKLFWPLLQHPALLRADCFHATSEAECEDIRRLGFAQPIAIIPNGIDVPIEVENSIATQRRTLLFLGRIHPTKGLDLLLKGWREVEAQFPDWDLRIVGSDSGYREGSTYMADLKRMVVAFGLKRVTFAGELRGADKWIAFQQAELFVLPTRSENFGVAVAEALSAGTPVVVTRGAPWGGLVERGAGWWVDISVDALVEALREAMCCSVEDLADRGRRGREWMRLDFEWAGIGRRMEDTYRWLTGDVVIRPDWVRVD